MGLAPHPAPLAAGRPRDGRTGPAQAVSVTAGPGEGRMRRWAYRQVRASRSAPTAQRPGKSGSSATGTSPL